jgi:hypothetical protein
MDRIAPTRELTHWLKLLRDVMDARPESISGLPHLQQGASDLFRVKSDPLFAVGTNDVIITLEPTERLIELVSALRAREGEFQVSTKG